MRVTEIRQTKRGRISIYIDGEFACVLHPEIYVSSGIHTGADIAPEMLGEAYRASQEKMARERALSLLSQRPYTAKALHEKIMEKIEDEEIASAAVQRMAELGLIDDADYARRYAMDCVNLRGYSISRTAQALREKGIDRDIIDSVLEHLDYDPEQSIARMVKQKYLRYLDDEKGVRKTIAALQRRGYRYGDIRTVLQNLAEDENYYEDM